jgi:cytoplasmic iron level regulating protein YaaA (DUF328/UPF0246 family)
MIAVISPAKTLDFETKVDVSTTQPTFKKEVQELIDVLKKKEITEVKTMMSLSDQLAELNVTRYHKFRKSHNEKNSKPAVYAFKGDVYQGLDVESLDSDTVGYAQNHLRILSGLYGVLKPLDLIQPYRLEMGTKLSHAEYKNLYQYWGDKITNRINLDLKRQGDKILVNLASQEYFKAVERKALKADVIDFEFLDFHQGELKMISFFAKKARGMMTRFILSNKIAKIKDLQEFDTDGYRYDPSKSTEQKLVFVR